MISELYVYCVDCTEGADNIPDRSLRGNSGGQHGDLSVDRDIEEWQTIADEVLHNASGDCWFVYTFRSCVLAVV